MRQTPVLTKLWEIPHLRFLTDPCNVVGRREDDSRYYSCGHHVFSDGICWFSCFAGKSFSGSGRDDNSRHKSLGPRLPDEIDSFCWRGAYFPPDNPMVHTGGRMVYRVASSLLPCTGRHYGRINHTARTAVLVPLTCDIARFSIEHLH